LLEKFKEKLWIVKILIPSIGTVSLIEFVGHPGSLGRSHMRRLWAKNSRAVEDAQDAI
jgi:hypothetical protein